MEHEQAQDAPALQTGEKPHASWAFRYGASQHERMLIIDLLTRTSRAMRDLGAKRWEVPSTTPRVMAEFLRKDGIAHRLFRRAGDAGAPQLVGLLVEHGGQPIKRQAALEAEADKLRGWFPWLETETSWCIPADLAAAMSGAPERERFFGVTLLSRLSTNDQRELLLELGLSASGSRPRWVARAVDAIAEREIDPSELREAADTVEGLQSIRGRDIASVSYVSGSGGLLYAVTMADGERFELCPREVAERVGATFDDVEVESATPTPVLRESRVRLPPFTAVGALITFATARAAEEAFAEADFRSIAARRLDERRVATRATCSAEDAATLLEDLGFRIGENGEASL